MERVAAFLALAIIGITAAGPTANAQTETVVEIPARSGQTVRALLLKPRAPVGSVILLAGGHGNLSLGKSGKIGWGAGNQLVRTRAGYAKAGFITLVPDIARDLKQGKGGVPRYRWSEAYATDIGFFVLYLRKVAQPVYLVGTSRAALSVANAAARLQGNRSPDAIVITSGMLMHVNDTQPSVQRNVGRLERITQPTFLVSHAQDGCAYTPASQAKPFGALLTKAAKVDIKIVEGGSAGSGDPCEARSHHGFQSQDAEVVTIVTDWLKALPK
jgi:pimeloyl-ACP methyl ester carboxylesterase